MAAGRPAAEAKGLAFANAQLPHLAYLRDLARELPQLQAASNTASDPSGSASLADPLFWLSQQLQDHGPGRMLIDQLVGMAMEKSLLQQLPDLLPNSADRLQQLTDARAEIQDLSRLISTRLQYTSESEALSYFDRVKLQGETAALRWLRDRATADPLPAPAP